MLIRGQRKKRREVGTKNRDRVEVKIWLQVGGQLQGIRKGVGMGNFWKNDRNLEKISDSLTFQECFQQILGNVEKVFFGFRVGFLK